MLIVWCELFNAEMELQKTENQKKMKKEQRLSLSGNVVGVCYWFYDIFVLRKRNNDSYKFFDK